MMTVDPLYWRDQALQKRIMASRMKDPLAQAAMIRLASHYAELAKHAEGSIGPTPEWLRLHPPFPDAQSVPAEERPEVPTVGQQIGGGDQSATPRAEGNRDHRPLVSWTLLLT